jgi:hypothetical protein
MTESADKKPADKNEGESLDDVINDIEQDEQEQAVKEGEVITQKEQQEEQLKYKAAMEKGYAVMGTLRAGIDKVWPFVSFGEDTDEEQLIHDGAKRHADVFVKYDLPDAPGWLQEYMPEIKLGILYGTIGFTMWLQIRERRRQEEAEAEKTEKSQEPENAES